MGQDRDELGGAIGPDRRTFVKRLVGMAFAAPVVSSFTMSGIDAVFGGMAGATTAMANTSPAVFQPVTCKPVSVGGGTISAAGITLVVQPNTFPTTMQICLEQANPANLGSYTPSGYDPRSGVGVSWVGPNAAIPLQLTVADSMVATGDELFRVTNASVTPQGGSVDSGTWSVSFSDDPAFVVARAPAVPPTDPPAGPGAPATPPAAETGTGDAATSSSAAAAVIADPRTAG